MHQVNISRSEEKISSLNPFSLGQKIGFHQKSPTQAPLFIILVAQKRWNVESKITNSKSLNHNRVFTKTFQRLNISKNPLWSLQNHHHPCNNASLPYVITFLPKINFHQKSPPQSPSIMIQSLRKRPIVWAIPKNSLWSQQNNHCPCNNASLH